jgi:hypothetical protein
MMDAEQQPRLRARSKPHLPSSRFSASRAHRRCGRLTTRLMATHTHRHHGGSAPRLRPSNAVGEASICVLDEKWPLTTCSYMGGTSRFQLRSPDRYDGQRSRIMFGQPLPKEARPLVEEMARREDRVLIRLSPEWTVYTPPVHLNAGDDGSKLQAVVLRARLPRGGLQPRCDGSLTQIRDTSRVPRSPAAQRLATLQCRAGRARMPAVSIGRGRRYDHRRHWLGRADRRRRVRQAQTFADWELIRRRRRSNRTRQAAVGARCSREVPTHPPYLPSRSRRGGAAARNRGIAASSGEAPRRVSSIGWTTRGTAERELRARRVARLAVRAGQQETTVANAVARFVAPGQCVPACPFPQSPRRAALRSRLRAPQCAGSTTSIILASVVVRRRCLAALGRPFDASLPVCGLRDLGPKFGYRLSRRRYTSDRRRRVSSSAIASTTANTLTPERVDGRA